MGWRHRTTFPELSLDTLLAAVGHIDCGPTPSEMRLPVNPMLTATRCRIAKRLGEQTEGMALRVDHDAHTALGLLGGFPCAALQCPADRCAKIAHPNV